MKLLRLTVFTLVLSLNLCAQNYKWFVNLNYPITIDKNFIGENYTGFIDLGLRYYLAEFEYLSLGASFNTSILANNDNLDITSLGNYKAIAFGLQPKITILGKIPTLEVLHPFLGVGYSFYLFSITGVNPGLGIVENGETLSGLSFNGGFDIDISDHVIIHLEYYFTRLQRSNLVPDTRYNKNINLVKLGAGYRF
ncbi:outer membrane beta-barrel protein [Winogradskyella aurantiaca]|uniref:outer membrane beta-barrel protein n=1 Tax=Winogradskyella aurantiaca TaxID=2219558 RepID=UPI000E1D66E7|nr:outer membrane beta-barrel protein [Winogradskyella aurantiaca]